MKTDNSSQLRLELSEPAPSGSQIHNLCFDWLVIQKFDYRATKATRKIDILYSYISYLNKH